MQLQRRQFLVLVAGASGLESACSFSENDLSEALQLAEAGIDTLVGILGQAGKIPPPEQTTIASWAATAAAAVSFASTEIISGDTTAVKIQKIDAAFAPILTSLDPNAEPWIALAQADLNAFLAILTPTGAVANADGSVTMHGVVIKPHISLPLFKGKFKKIASDADATAAKVHKMFPNLPSFKPALR